MRFFKKQKDVASVADLSAPAPDSGETQKVSLGGFKRKYEDSSVVDVDVIESDVTAKEGSGQKPETGVDSPKSSFFSKFGKSTKSKEESAPLAPTAEAPAEKSSPLSKWKFGAKKEKNPSTGEQAAAAKPKKKKSKSNSHLYLSTEIENGQTIFWELGVESLKQLERPPEGARVFSFSKDDIRYRAGKALSDRKAQGVALADIGENVGIVNLSKGFGAIYACRLSKLQAEPYVVAPGVQFFEPEILSREPDQDQILGAVLTDSETGQSMAILVHVNSVGDAEAAQVSLNPEDMNFVLSQFMASRKMNRAQVRTLIFNNEEVIALSKDAKPYPSSLMFYGIPLSTLQNMVALSAGVAALGCIAWAGFQYYNLEEMTKQRTQLNGAIERLTAQRLDVLSNSLGSITAEMSTNTQDFLAKAESFWVPGAKVTASAGQDTWEYAVILPLAGEDVASDGLSTSVRELSQLQQLTGIAVPDTCSKSTLTSAETQNEFKITISCSIERGRFASIVQ